MELSNLTTIGRSVDPRYPTVRAILIVAILVTAAGALLQRLSGGAWAASLLWGVNAGLSVFLAWALCRELDPDHPLSAFVAAGLCLVSLPLWGLPRLTVVLWLIVVLRVVNRTVGAPAGFLDSLGLLGLGSWLSLQGNWGYGVITALAFLLDSQLRPRARRQLVFAILAVVAAVVIAIVGPGLPWAGPPSLVAGLIALALSALFLPTVITARHLTSVGDRSQEPLVPARVQAAQLLALLAGVETAFLGGTAALAALLPLWAAVLAASLTCLALSLRSVFPNPT